MTSYANEWEDTPEREATNFEDREMDEVPDGTYDADVVDWSFFRGKGGEWFVSWWFSILAGVYAGSMLQRFTTVEGGISFIKADLRVVLGDVPGWHDLVDDQNGRCRPEVRERIVGATVTIRQRTRKKGSDVFVDVFINRLVEAAPDPGGERKPDPVDEDPREGDPYQMKAVQDRERAARLPEQKTSPRCKDCGGECSPAEELCEDCGQGAPPSAPAPTDADAPKEGWGDPDCPDCHGSGCATCADF